MLAAAVAPCPSRRSLATGRELVVSAGIIAITAMATWFATRDPLPLPAPIAGARTTRADALATAASADNGSGDFAAAESRPRAMHVQSDPPGAAVWYAGEPLGYTPLELNLPLPRSTDPGLLLVKEGFQTQRLSLAGAADGAALAVTLEALRAPERIAPPHDKKDFTADDADDAAFASRPHAESAAPTDKVHAQGDTAPNAELVTWRTRRPSRDSQTLPDEHEPHIESGSRDSSGHGRIGPGVGPADALSAGQYVAIVVGRVADAVDLAAARERARLAVDSLREDQSLCLLIESATGLIDVFGRFAPADALRRIRARDAIDAFTSVAPDSTDAGTTLIDLSQCQEADCVWLLCADARHNRPWPAPRNETPARQAPRIVVECVHGEPMASSPNSPDAP